MHTSGNYSKWHLSVAIREIPDILSRIALRNLLAGSLRWYASGLPQAGIQSQEP
jgi:hypothetical protein